MAAEVPCRRHPESATRLRCGSCGDAICPRCMVHGHVGVRCPDCGKSVTLPTYQVSGLYLVRAVAAAAAAGVAAGFVYALVFSAVPWLGLIVLVGIGYLVAEAATAAAGRKRGRIMQYAAVVGILACMVIILLFGRGFSVWTLLGAVMAIVVGTSRVR